MNVGAIAYGARALLTVVFILAVIEKVITLQRKSAAWHPVLIVSRWRRNHAPALIDAALMSDLTAVVLLVVTPPAGAVVSIAILLAYTVAAIPMHAAPTSSPCRCMWKILDTTTRGGLLLRNALLALLSSTLIVASPIGSVEGWGWTLSLFAMVATANRLASRTGRRRTRGKGPFRVEQGGDHALEPGSALVMEGEEP